MATSFLPYF